MKVTENMGLLLSTMTQRILVKPQAQKPPEIIPAFEGFKDQENSTYIQGSSAVCQASFLVFQDPQSSLQTFSQTFEPLDPRTTGQLQIPTNPRIAPDLPSNQSKYEQGSYVTGGAAKPAYISVPMQKRDEKATSHDAKLCSSLVYFQNHCVAMLREL